MSRVVILSLWLVAEGVAQTSASLRGLVRDADAAPVQGARVEIRNQATGKVTSQETNAAGEFVEPVLEPGRYQVSAKAERFQDYERRDLDLGVGQKLTLRIRMLTMASKESMEINAGAGQLNVSSGALSVNVDKDQIRDLPLNGRSFEQLSLLQPGVTLANSAGSSFYGARGRAISVNGARPEQNSFLLDGTDMMNAFNKTPGSAAGVLLGVEGVLEYQVLTNSYAPEFGRAAGGVVNVATRGGANQWNGSLFYFLRNSALDAKNYFNPAGAEIPGFKRNQFGGTVGGAIRKDRTFFFLSYEQLKERLGVISSTAVPDAEARRGMLPTGPVAVSPVIQPYLNRLFPVANGRSLGGGAAEYNYSLSQPTDDRFAQGRVDHRFSDRNSVFARYTITEGTVDRVPLNTVPASRLLETGRNQYVGAEWTSMASPSLFLSTRVAFSRSASATLNRRTIADIDSLSFVPGAPFGFLTVTGLTSSVGGDARVPREDYLNNFQYTGSALWLRGRHSWKFGVSTQRQQFNTFNALQQGGAVTFNNLADFLRGTARSIDYSIPGFYDPVRGFRQSLVAGFAGDEFRLKPNLTITYGVRYEFASVPREVNGKISNLREVLDSTLAVGDPYFANPSTKNFAPRVGFAWSPGDKGQWVVRGGYGIFFDLILPRSYFIVATRNPPFSNRVLVNSPRFPLTPGDVAAWRTIPPSVNSFAPNPANPYLSQFNLTVDRLWRGWTISTGYVGSRGQNLTRQAEANLAVSSVVNGVRTYNPAAGRVNPAFAGIVRVETDAQSFYNGLQVSAIRTLAKGVRAQVSYTFSKSIDDTSGIVSSDFINSTQYTLDYTDRRLDRGLSSFHAAHVFVANGAWMIPAPAGARGWSRHLMRGWQLHNITTVQSGHPFSLLMGFNRSGNLNTASLTFHDRPDVNPEFRGNPITGDPRRYWDINYVRMPAANVRGNLGRNTLIGPGLLMIDASLVKPILTRERMNLVLRTEMFNLTNTPNFAPPIGRTAFTNAGGGVAANQGVINSTVTSSRQLQFALKLTF